jgi:hypothetical protein
MAILRMFPAQQKAAVFLLVSVSLSCLFFCPPASAQSKSKLPEIDVFGGYSYLRFDAKTLGFSDNLNMNGADISVAMPHIYKGLGAAIDVSGNFATELEVFNFSIGPQYTYEWKRMRLYGHGLFGKARARLQQPGATSVEPSYLSNGFAIGGGLDFPLSGRFSVRVIQADYVITNDFGTRQNNVRLSTGVIYRFGKKE